MEDIDGDGKLDLVTADKSDNSISVFRNTSTVGNITAASFAPKVSFTTGQTPTGVTVNDFDGDGKPDIAVSNSSGNTVLIFYNKTTTGVLSTSSFSPKVDFVVDRFPTRIAAADIDGDGKIDLITGNSSGSSISILKNTAIAGSITSSSFAGKVDFAVGTSPSAINIADLDADGKPDIALTNNGNLVTLLRNTAVTGSINNGSLAAKIDITVPNQPQSICITDIDGDGAMDILTGNFSGNSLSVIRNLKNGAALSSSTFAPVVNIAVTGPYTVNACDLDGDGKPDVLIGNSQSIISVMHNSPALPPPVINSFSPSSAGVGSTVTIKGSNFNAEVAANIVYFGVTKAVITSASTTQLTVTVPLGSSYQPISVLNTESHRIAYSSTSFITTFNSTNKLTTSDFAPYVESTYGDALAIGDIDGDGKPDLLTNYGGGSNWQLVIKRNASTVGNIGAALFPDGATIDVTGPILTAVLADVDGDGKLDIIYALNDSSNPTQAVTILHNVSTPGNFRFDAPVTRFVIGFKTLATADIDGDGKVDLLASYYGNIAIYRNTTTNGIITFADQVNANTNLGASGVVKVNDFDGDGKPDLVINSTNDYGFSIFRNKSSPGVILFDNAVKINTITTPNVIATGDIDGDGKPDVVVSNIGGSISVYQNNSTVGNISTNSFTRTNLNYGGTHVAVALNIADIDGDGKPDILFINSLNYANQFVCLYKNNTLPGAISSSSFSPVVSLSTDYLTTYDINTCDLDGDGKPDIVTSAYFFRNDPATYLTPVVN